MSAAGLHQSRLPATTIAAQPVAYEGAEARRGHDGG